MFSQWLHRGKLGQMLAPDPTFVEDDETKEKTEFAGGIWDIIAPDPNFINSRIPKVKHSNDDEAVLDTYSTPEKSVTNTHNGNSSGKLKSDHILEARALSAAKGLAEGMLSPPNIWEDVNKFFTLCASFGQLNEKKLKRVKKMLRKDPSLATARASNMGNLVPNGFTPLHAASFAGNKEVAEILINFEIEEKDGQKVTKYHPVDLYETDVLGRTALHVASEQGQIDLVRLLVEKMTERNGLAPLGENAPIDLSGRTPLGWAATSRATKAKSNINTLRNELFSPGDKSIYGQSTPASVRTGGIKIGERRVLSMDLRFAYSDMPGHRVTMEDAICHCFPLVPPSRPKVLVGFFGVFDGHGDGGVSSKFISKNLIRHITSSLEWETFDGNIEPIAQAMHQACIIADNDLKEILASKNSIQHGGSTGVMAFVTSTSILVGNVGDSRCILVKRDTSNVEESLSKEMKKLSTENETESTSEPEISNVDGIHVTALSTDHKPDIPDEKARIEKAGMEVIEEIFNLNGKVTRFSKIQKDSSNKIAVSRAFGDFDYKDNEEVLVDEQAIVCTPEITVHKRDHSCDMYMILACDGVYDVMSNNDVGKFVVDKAKELRKSVDEDSVLAKVGDELLKRCLELGSTDNMSVLIVAFPHCDTKADNITRTLDFADV